MPRCWAEGEHASDVLYFTNVPQLLECARVRNKIVLVHTFSHHEYWTAKRPWFVYFIPLCKPGKLSWVMGDLGVATNRRPPNHVHARAWPWYNQH